MRSETVDLVYLDPPFYSKRGFYTKNGKQTVGFDDRWPGGIGEYTRWMSERLAESKRVLKKTGSIYVHCDPHASHYLKVAMDAIFGTSNFRNEIIWKRQSSHNDGRQGARHFGRIHDSILFFTKSRHYTWNPLFQPYSEGYVRKQYRHVGRKGRMYALGDLSGPSGTFKGNPVYKFMGIVRSWRYSKKKMKRLLREGKIVQKRPGTVPQLKRYLDEMPGLPIQDVWTDITPITSFSKERVAFPTQKPQTLLERILLVSTNPGDLVVDPFCGCGSALIAAQNLRRRWVGVDISHKACLIVKKRMSSVKAKARVIDLRKIAGTAPSLSKSDAPVRGYDKVVANTRFPGLWLSRRLSGRLEFDMPVPPAPKAS